MYDDFSVDYDRFVDWQSRLAAEMPFIADQIGDSARVLDAACGTGMHAIALAQQGYEVAGADLSAGMIERAQANAEAAEVDVRLGVAGLGELASRFPSLRAGEGEGSFDAVLCLGNSLPHLLTPADLEVALSDFAACLQPGGLLLIQNRNFDAVLSQRERWMAPQAHREEATEWLFLRFYDFEPDGKLSFNVLTLRREGTEAWNQQITSTRLWPMQQGEVVAALEATGFSDIACFGDMQGGSFSADTSGNLVVVSRRKR
jgi:SAM-dependent methyltransferase